MFNDYWDGWKFPSDKIWIFLKQTSPVCISYFLEGLNTFILTMLITRLDPIYISVFNIQSTYILIIWSIFWGGTLSTTRRIGYHLGDANELNAKTAIKCGLIICFVISLIGFSATILLRRYIGYIFTHDSKLLLKLEESFPYCAAYIIVYLVGLFFVEILESMCRTRIAGIITFISDWIISLPLAIYLGFYSEFDPIVGIWIGCACGKLTAMILAIIALYFTNWNNQIDKAIKRNENENENDYLLTN